MAQQTLFSYFGLSPRFRIDLDRLEAAHLAAIKKVHPDLFAQRPAAERRVAEQWSTRLNEAYQTLKDPVRRATYLCESAGWDVGAEKNTAMPMDFLLLQMRWRETLDNQKDNAEVINRLREEVLSLEGEVEVELEKALDVDANYDAAVALVRKLMFITKFRAQLQQIQ